MTLLAITPNLYSENRTAELTAGNGTSIIIIHLITFINIIILFGKEIMQVFKTIISIDK